MLMRVSIGIHKDDIEAALKTYHTMSQRWFTHASPTLFNAGTARPQVGSISSNLHSHGFAPNTEHICILIHFSLASAAQQLFSGLHERGQH
jgi:hypothetical protein